MSVCLATENVSFGTRSQSSGAWYGPAISVCLIIESTVRTDPNSVSLTLKIIKFFKLFKKPL